jgi:hypothetical protein
MEPSNICNICSFYIKPGYSLVLHRRKPGGNLVFEFQKPGYGLVIAILRPGGNLVRYPQPIVAAEY